MKCPECGCSEHLLITIELILSEDELRVYVSCGQCNLRFVCVYQFVCLKIDEGGE